MSRKLKVTEKLRAALRIAVEEVKPIRAKIRTTKERKRNYRRNLHLGICYVKGTPYRKAEARTCYDTGTAEPQPFEIYLKKNWVNTLVRDVAKTLIQFECMQGKAVEDVQKDVRVWIGDESAKAAVCPVRPLKLYVVVREDLPPGAQAVQAAHAMREFAAEHPEIEREWHEKSNTVVMLATDEANLKYLLEQAKLRGVETSVFREPDLNNILTAVCFGTKGYKLPLRNLSLALKEKAA